MAGFSLRKLLDVITPRMIVRGLIYPLRTASRVRRSTPRGTSSPKVKSGTYPAAPLETFSFLGNVTQFERDEDGRVTVTAENGKIRLTPLADDLVQVRVRPDGMFVPPFSYAVAKPEGDWPPVESKLVDTDDQIELHTRMLRIVVHKHPCRLSVLDQAGRLLLSDVEGVGHQADGQLIWRTSFREGAACYGLGEKASALNHVGRRFEMWNVDPSGYERGDDPLYMSVPFLVVQTGGIAAGIFIDNSYHAQVDIGATTPHVLEYRTLGGEFRVYLMAGTPQTVLERFTELTGRMNLPPLWTLGFHQSRWSYYPQSRVLEIAREFRQRHLPCDAIHLDIDYMDDCRCFTWDKRRFPDVQGMLAELHAQGFKAMAIIDPGIKIDPGYWVFREGIQRDAFICYPDGSRYVGPVWPGDCHFPDFTNPAVREWWGGLYQGLLDDGLDAFWNDMNEFALITLKPRTTAPDILHYDAEGRGATEAEIHNVYGMLMARASFEGLRRLRPDRRPFVLTRSGWAGVQRYAVHWTADNKSTWDHLRLSISMVLNLGLSGIPFTGPDTGGFTGGPTPELFARWMQVSAFLPFYRVHSMIKSPDQEPWAFGPEVEAICRKYLELRYRLLPYLYTAVWQATRTGIPIVRALSFMYPDDLSTYSLDDQFLFGDSLLVAPILEAGAEKREVYLPAGEWYDFWTGQLYKGQQTVTVEAPLDVLPLFVRAGAVIPFWPVQQYVGEKQIDQLELYAYYSAGEHTSLLYEDDGVTPDYVSPEAYRLSRFCLRGGEEGQSLSIERVIEQGSYAEVPEQIRLHVIGLKGIPSRTDLEAGELLAQAHDPSTGRLAYDLKAPEAFRITILQGR